MEVLWKSVGWLGNIAFFSRFFVQWRASEKAGHSVAPTIFWWLSLLGSTCSGLYTLHRGESVLLAGHALNGALFARNLHLSLRPKASPNQGRGLAVIAALMVLAIIALGFSKVRSDMGQAPIWLAVALAGQLVWSSRFVVQWWQSERAGHSHFPVLFWWISLVGNGLLLAYTSHLGDPILIAGYLPGPLIQARNLMLGQGPAASRGKVPLQDPQDG